MTSILSLFFFRKRKSDFFKKLLIKYLQTAHYNKQLLELTWNLFMDRIRGKSLNVRMYKKRERADENT